MIGRNAERTPERAKDTLVYAALGHAFHPGIPAAGTERLFEVPQTWACITEKAMVALATTVRAHGQGG